MIHTYAINHSQYRKLKNKIGVIYIYFYKIESGILVSGSLSDPQRRIWLDFYKKIYITAISYAKRIYNVLLLQFIIPQLS